MDFYELNEYTVITADIHDDGRPDADFWHVYASSIDDAGREARRQMAWEWGDGNQDVIVCIVYGHVEPVWFSRYRDD